MATPTSVNAPGHRAVPSRPEAHPIAESDDPSSAPGSGNAAAFRLGDIRPKISDVPRANVISDVGPVATPVAVEEGSDQVWQSVAPLLDTLWGVDTAQIVTVLEEFRGRFPDFEPAREKLYAARLTRAAELLAVDDRDGAAKQLVSAIAMLPDRAEGQAQLLALESTVRAPDESVGASAQNSGSAALNASQSQIARANAAPRAILTPRPTLARGSAPFAASAPPPTPTKVPFHAPSHPE